MKFSKILITLLIPLQTTFVFPLSWQMVWVVVKAPLLQIDLLMLSSSESSSSSSAPSQEQIASLKDLQILNKNVEAAIQEIINFKNELINYLEQTALSSLFEEISSYWVECVDILEAYDAEEFESEEQFQETFGNLRQRMSERIFLVIEKIRYDKAFLYLERIRTELITSEADITTYSVKLTLAIKDYVLHSSKVICLLDVAGSDNPQFKNSITRLIDDLKEFEGYHEQYVLGSWFNMAGHLLSEGDQNYYSGKILQMFGSQSHIVLSIGDVESFKSSSAYVTPLRITPAPGADIGDFSIKIQFQTGFWRNFCAAGDTRSIKLDCEDEEVNKWKPTPCPSSSTTNETHLDCLCIKHVASGLFLTYVSGADGSESLVITEFDENNSNQLFNLTEVRRCCQISSDYFWVGGKEICLESNQAIQEALVLPEELPFGSGACGADVHLFTFEGRNFSKKVFPIFEGTEISWTNAVEPISVMSYYIESACARIFTDQNLTGGYNSICEDMPTLGGNFALKNVSVLVVNKPLELFEGDQYTGNSIIVRRSMMNLDDWPFDVRSVRFEQAA